MNDKVIGNTIENNLTWSQHVDKVCKKIKNKPVLWPLSRIKDYLTTSKRVKFHKTDI